MTRQITYVIIALLLFISCKKQEEEKDYVARVYDKYLYTEDIEKLLKEKKTVDIDSATLVESYIKDWGKDQLLIKKAEINLDQDLNEIDKLVNKYRQDLLINKYKTAAVEQYLDTVITKEDVEKFYNSNKDIFRLNEELVKLRYIHYDDNLMNARYFENLLRSGKSEDMDSIRVKGFELKSFNLNDSIWIRYSDFRKKVPGINQYEEKLIFDNTSFFKKKNSKDIYLIAVKGALKRNETAPISYVLPTIKQMIIHKRKLQLLRKIEETLIDDAIKNKEFEIYEAK